MRAEGEGTDALHMEWDNPDWQYKIQMKPSQTIIQNCSSCKLILNNNDDNLIHDDKISKNDRHCEEMIVILVNDCNAGT